MQKATAAGTLYVVATPIGHLGDLSQRARETLAGCHLIAAEDTRHSLRLLQHYGIQRPMISLHEHNEMARLDLIAGHLECGEDVALISDAGTPLISDPGSRLCQQLRMRGFRLSPIPGPCAAVAALSVSGLAFRQWMFLGFPPAREGPRRAMLEPWRHSPFPLVLYEAPHRVISTLQTVADVFGPTRQLSLGRELTKRHETLLVGSVSDILSRVSADSDQQRGEIVLIIDAPENPPPVTDASELDVDRLVRVLGEELPPARAARVIAELTGQPRRDLYRRLSRGAPE